MKLQDCSVHRTLGLIDGKWKPIILYQLKKGKMRSSAMARAIPEASAKVLTQQLREFEKSGLVLRTIFPSVPPKVEYSLTELGKSLRPALQALADFGSKYKQRVDD
jgi:DNA-binding HxlR family transcriptional regulator